VAELGGEARFVGKLRHPSGHVRSLSTRSELRHRIRVGALRERLREADDHIEQQVAERHDHE
jgi:hypothetical protein